MQVIPQIEAAQVTAKVSVNRSVIYLEEFAQMVASHPAIQTEHC